MFFAHTQNYRKSATSNYRPHPNFDVDVKVYANHNHSGDDSFPTDNY